MDVKPIVKGIPASSGIAEGKAIVIKETKEMEKMIERGILVTTYTTPLLTPAILNSSGIVTDKGGVMCHAAIIAREFGIPCVTGTEDATKRIKHGTSVIVDGTKGYVYKK